MIPGIMAGQVRGAAGAGVAVYPAAYTPVTLTYDGTTHKVFAGSVADDGDLMLILIVLDGNTTVATPGGWTLKAAPVLNGSSARAYLFERVKQPGDGEVDLISSASTRSSIISARIAAGTFDPSATRYVAGVNSAAATSVDLPAVTDTEGAAPHLVLSFAAVDSRPTITGYPLPNQQASQLSSATPGVTAAVCTQTTDSNTLDPAAYSFSASAPSYAISLMVRGYPA